MKYLLIMLYLLFTANVLLANENLTIIKGMLKIADQNCRDITTISKNIDIEFEELKLIKIKREMLLKNMSAAISNKKKWSSSIASNTKYIPFLGQYFALKYNLAQDHAITTAKLAQLNNKLIENNQLIMILSLDHLTDKKAKLEKKLVLLKKDLSQQRNSEMDILVKKLDIKLTELYECAK